MRNVTCSKSRDFRVVLKSRAFGRGFRDYREGKPLDPNAYRGTNDQWSYERGRLFAAAYEGPLRLGRGICGAALAAARHEIYSGGLI